MANEWIVEFTDEFELWWLELSELVQEKCAAVVDLLTREGPNLGFPYSSSIRGSAHALRECCGNYVFNVAGIRIGSSTHLIRNEMLC